MSADQSHLEKILVDSFNDRRVDDDEKQELLNISFDANIEERSFLKNRAFDLVRELASRHDSQREELVKAIGWLKKVTKSIDKFDAHKSSIGLFSPGESCRNTIIKSCKKSRRSLSICVFTISDNIISQAIQDAHERGVKVRIITDNDKRYDKGSDIERLQNSGIDIRFDRTPNHMHHKFAIFDDYCLLNGSFNWTRSATERNEENIVQHFDTKLITIFQEKFEQLWTKFSS